MSKNKNKKPSPKNKPKRQRENHASKGNFREQKKPAAGNIANGLWLYGKHAVLSALENPERLIKRLMVTKRSHDQYQPDLSKIHLNHRALNPEIAAIEVFDKNLPTDSVHQGIALLTDPLPDAHLDDCCTIIPDQKNLVLILDQVTDPHNVGAIIRSAAAFGARAIITTDRHAPPESGVLAKSASGALEALPWVRVTNLSRALDQLAEMGYWRIGLDGYADQDVRDVNFGDNIALVLGAEGKGIRKGTADHCDGLVKLPISRTVESLNVSNAAAVALYVFSA
ncbi:MAG: 23S rRNA (guanosine(2251)-2'-O)-methyltransferase RlmB [Emcibacteraceae bacterium]|nr:23S rRNA (guanosine(2251)-2'-O)-methyltransferase RlmB [Emcibacteraceae bacterium]